jgi:hypothetical protein
MWPGDLAAKRTKLADRILCDYFGTIRRLPFEERWRGWIRIHCETVIETMTHITRTTGWGVIDVDLEDGRVFFQQRWRYHWKTQGTPSPSEWRMSEKLDFHHHVDRQIWDTWSNKVVLGVSGTAPFVRKFKTSGVKINFDVRWVLSSGDYEVDAIKVPVGSAVASDMAHTRSSVTFSSRKIQLYANDLAPRSAKQSGANPAVRKDFRMVPHEFGHTIKGDDEYMVMSFWRSDADSVMNVGRQLRNHHLKAVIAELNQMIPGCVLSLASIS